MENTYVVYSEEYYFSVKELRTILKKRVYTVTQNEEDANEIRDMMEEVLKNDLYHPNNNNEMLTAYDMKIITLEGVLSSDDAKSMVINDDFTWGKVGSR